jgi:hypothetical protein
VSAIDEGDSLTEWPSKPEASRGLLKHRVIADHDQLRALTASERSERLKDHLRPDAARIPCCNGNHWCPAHLIVHTHIESTKHQTRRLEFGAWSLVLVWNLGFGIWCFGLYKALRNGRIYPKSGYLN